MVLRFSRLAWLTAHNAVDGWDKATAIGTIGAAVFAALATVVSARLVKLESDRRKQEIEDAQRAHVRGALRQERQATLRQWVQVWNEGPAAAQQVTMEMEDDEFVHDRTELPSTLYAGQRADLLVSDSLAQAVSLVTLRWVDGGGPQEFVVAKTYLHTEP